MRIKKRSRVICLSVVMDIFEYQVRSKRPSQLKERKRKNEKIMMLMKKSMDMVHSIKRYVFSFSYCLANRFLMGSSFGTILGKMEGTRILPMLLQGKMLIVRWRWWWRRRMNEGNKMKNECLFFRCFPFFHLFDFISFRHLFGFAIPTSYFFIHSVSFILIEPYLLASNHLKVEMKSN